MTYKAPFTSEGLLLPGRKWVDVEVADQAGNKAASRLAFTVITNSVPGVRASARQRPRGKYDLLHVDEEWSSFYQQKIAEAASQGYVTHQIAVHKLISRFVVTSNWPNFPMLVLRKPGATQLTTASKYVLGAHEFKSIKDFLKRPQFEVVTRNARVPRFVVDMKAWPSFRSADSDADVASVAFALKASAEAYVNTAEVWAAAPARNGDQDVLVAFYSPRVSPLNPRPELGRIIHVYVTKQRGTNYFAPTRLNIPGRWEVAPVDSRFRAHGDYWPDQASFLVRQWGETARNVMAYKADYQNVSHHAFEENSGPKYFDHVLGEIAADGLKPYYLFSGRAEENNIDIATQAPRFSDDRKRNGYYGEHGADFFATSPRDYELTAQRFFIGSRDHRIFADRRNTKYYFEPIIDGDKADKSPFGIVESNNNIVTFYIPSEIKPGVGEKPRPYWIKQINRRFDRPIFPEDRNEWRQEFPEAEIPG